MVSTNEPARQKPTLEKGKGVATSSKSKKKTAPSAKEKRAPKVKLPTQRGVFERLMRIRFEQSKFIEERLLHQLGIHGDVMLILDNMGLGKFMRMREPADQTSTCQFLSTLTAAFYRPSSPEYKTYGRGFIQFKVGRIEYMVNFGELCTIFGFADEASSNDHRFVYPLGEHLSLWGTIASGRFESGVSKAALIRNPAIRYAYKALMLTFHAKVEADTMFQDTLEFLGLGLKPLLPTFSDGGVFIGPTESPCLATLLARTLMDYKEWACRTTAKKAYIGIGWIVTAILRATTRDFQINEQELPLIDELYLQKGRFFKKVENGFEYIFHPTSTSTAKVHLPHPHITRLDNLENIIFRPSRDFYLGTIQDEFDEPPRGARRYAFDPYTGPMNMAAASVAAHERISTLQRMNMWQQRQMEKMAKTIKGMKKVIRDLTCRGRDEGEAPRRMEISGEESSHHAPRKSKGKRPVQASYPTSSNESIDLATDSSNSPSPPHST